MIEQVTTNGRRLALLAALLGWMFDGMEMGLFPLVARSALEDLLQPENSLATGITPSRLNDIELENQISTWFSIVTSTFLIGAATGGVLFGWLGDKLGRIRAMTLSILLYSLCTGMSSAATAPWQLAVLRFFAALGMGGEWALGVALVMELWPNTSRAFLAGLIGACGNLGYTICAGINLGLNRIDRSTVASSLQSLGISDITAGMLTDHGYWRLLLLIGAFPAFLTLLIRIFVPESTKWKHSNALGQTTHWASRDLLAVLFGAVIAGGVIALWNIHSIPLAIRIVGLVGGFLLITFSYLYPTMKYLNRSVSVRHERGIYLRRILLAALLSGVPLLATWSGVMWMYQWVGRLPGGTDPDARPLLQVASSIGAALGCMLGALLAGQYGRRPVYAVLCVLSALTILGFYRLNTEYGTVMILFSAVLGLITASFYGWLPLYLPELFPTAIRASGQGFGFNFGRIIAAFGNLQMPYLLAYFNQDFSQACAIVPLVYIAGLVLIWFAPETRGKELPD